MDIIKLNMPQDTSWLTPELNIIEKYARNNYIPVLQRDTAALLIQTLAKCKPNTILEIGTAIGYSGTIMLSTCPNATMHTIEVDNSSYNIASNHFKQFNLTNRITQHLGDAKLKLSQLIDMGLKFDFIFLDGPKGQYIRYLPMLDKLLNDGGTLFADNVLYRHMVDGPEFVPHKHRTLVVNLRKYLAQVSTTPYRSTIYDVGDGVAITTREEQ